MGTDLSILGAVEECLMNGYGFEGEIVPDRIRNGCIEATFCRPGEEVGGLSLRIHVEVVEP